MEDTRKYLRNAIRNYGIEGKWADGEDGCLVLNDWKAKNHILAKLRLFWLGPVSSGWRFGTPVELFETGLWDAWGKWQPPLIEIWNECYNDACPTTYILLAVNEMDGLHSRCFKFHHDLPVEEVKLAPGPLDIWQPTSEPPRDKDEHKRWSLAQRREYLIEKYIGPVDYLDEDAKKLLNRFADPRDPEFGGLVNLKRHWNGDIDTLVATMVALQNDTPIFV